MEPQFPGQRLCRALWAGAGVTKDNGPKRIPEERESQGRENGQHVPQLWPSRVIRGLCTRQEQRVGGARERTCDWQAGGTGTLVIGRGHDGGLLFEPRRVLGSKGLGRVLTERGRRKVTNKRLSSQS